MQPKMILGYQYGPTTRKFIGEYWFPNNMDQEAVHTPPNTTLVPPPADVPKNMSAYWSGDKWFIAEDPDKAVPPLVVDDYSMVMPDFIDYAKKQGMWTAEHQQKYEAAVAERDAMLRAAQEEREAALRAMQEQQ